MGETLDKNRVFEIGALQELLDSGKNLLWSAMNISGTIESEIDSLQSIGSRIPREAIDSSFIAKAGMMTGTLNKPEFADCYDKLQTVLAKLIENAPEIDTSIAKVVNEITEVTGLINRRITDLRNLIGNPAMEEDYRGFLKALEEYKNDWDKTSTELEAKLNKIKAMLKGLEQKNCKYSSDPVNLATGNFVYDRIDLMIGGAHPLIIKRIYNSLDDSIGSFGRKWTHNLLTKLIKKEETTAITVVFEDSHEEVFIKKDEDTYESTRNNQSCLYFFDGKFILNTANYDRYLFVETGECIKKMDSRGNQFEFSYVGGQLKSISNLSGEIHLTYQEDGFISQVKDLEGRTQKYTYDQATLVKVEDETGIAIAYKYDKDGNISSVVNEQNICQVRNRFDEKGRTINQVFPDGGIMKYDYNDKKNAVILTQQNGNQITYIHDDNYQNTKVIHKDGEETFQFDEHGRRTAYIDKNGNRTRYQYNNKGDRNKIIDPYGYFIEIEYNSKRKPVSLRQKDGSQTHNFYNSKGYLIKSIDSIGRAIGYQYGKASRPEEIILCDNSRYKFTYDKRENITSITDALGNITYYEYDLLNRIRKTIDARGNVSQFEFDRNNRIIKVTNSLGNSRQYLYNQCGLVIKFIDFDGSSYKMSYNNINKLSEMIDPLGGITKYRYDTMWNLSCTMAANGARTQYCYHKPNQLSDIILEDGAKTSYQYDPNGNLIAVTLPNASTLRFEYDALNNNIALIDIKGNKSYKEYDCMGRVVRIYDGKGQESRFVYDRVGQLIQKTDSRGNRVHMTYNALGKKETFTDIRGNVTYYEYYPGGKLKKQSMPNGQSTMYRYDENGNVQSKESESGFQVFYHYDKLNRITEIIDSENRSKRFAYDAVSNVTGVIDENGNHTTYTYQPMKRLMQVADALGNETHYVYDSMGRLIAISHSLMEESDIKTDLYEEARELNQQDVFYERNALGRITAATDALGNKEYFNYDLMGNVTDHTDRNGNTAIYQYNELNKVSHITYADGRSVAFEYNELKQLRQIKDWLGITTFNFEENGYVSAITDHNDQTVKYQHNQLGQRTAIIYPGENVVNYSYDHLNRLIGMKNNTMEAVYHYDEVGRLNEKHLNNGMKTTYTYNAMGQLTELMNYNKDEILDHFRYAYDPAGNKLSIDKFRQGVECDSGVFDYEYDPLNRLIVMRKDEEQLRSYSYNGMGNRIDKIDNNNLTHYSYNELGQLVTTKDSKQEKQYSYDLCGNLQTIHTDGEISDTYRYDIGGNMVYANGEEFLYNGIGNKVGDFEGSYVLDLTKSYHNILMKNGDSYLWDQSILGEGDNVYLQDELGSPLHKIDANGKVLESYVYDEFGIRQQGKGRFAFTGYEDNNGICFAQARYYKPSLGRFLSRDKIKGHIVHPFTLNEYVYVYNNPLKYVDLDGNFPSWPDIGNAFSDAADWVIDTGSEVGSFIADTASSGADLVRKGLSAGADFVQNSFSTGVENVLAGLEFVENNIWNPAKTFLSNNVFLSPSEWMERFKGVQCYFANNSFCDVLSDLDNATNGLFKETAYSIITHLANMQIPDRIERTYNDVVPAPIRAVTNWSWSLNLSVFNWTMDKVCPSSVEDTVVNDLLYPVAGYGLGFNYDPEKDIYYTTEGSIQQQFGFGDAFDEIGPLLGMDLEAAVIVFKYNGREYLLEPWMGKYGFGVSTGAEIGIYSRSEAEAEDNPIEEAGSNNDVFFQSAIELEQLLMTYELIDSSTGKVVIDVNTADYTGYDYWALGIKAFDNTDKENLVMKATIQNEDIQYLRVMNKALNEEGIKADIKNGVLTFTWNPFDILIKNQKGKK